MITAVLDSSINKISILQQDVKIYMIVSKPKTNSLTDHKILVTSKRIVMKIGTRLPLTTNTLIKKRL